MTKDMPIVIGIDATNIRSGGGVTHLVEFLRSADPLSGGFSRIIVWSGRSTLSFLDDRPWLSKKNPDALNKGFLRRIIWQRFYLSKEARLEGCDVLLVPGGSYVGNFSPVVVMSQNLLPFETAELLRFGWSFFSLKLLLLRLTQSRSFQKTDGVIFLTEYARDTVLKITGRLPGLNCIVSHGLNPRFNSKPRPQKDITEYDDAHPFRILYVSKIDQYKHQWNVVEAAAMLRKQGLPIVLELVGSAYSPALKRLSQAIDRLDPERVWVRCHGSIPHEELHLLYLEVDLAVWASTCEAFGLILLEKMGSGLPIASSGRAPMREILGPQGVFFNPDKPHDIARALRELIDSPKIRMELAKRSYDRALQYSWRHSSDSTCAFLVKVVRQKKGTNV